MKAWTFFAVMLVALAAFCRCGSLNGGTNNRYVVSPLTDTLTIKLPGYENELCEVTVYGNNAHFYGTDYVMGGCVKFGVSSLPAGRQNAEPAAGCPHDARARQAASPLSD